MRVLLSLVFVMALFGSAVADKAKLAVLGLEVAGSPDQMSTSHARELTKHLRAKIDVSSRFVLAPNSKKDLLDEKVGNSCETEAVDCMAKIGAKLNAAVLVYGKLEKRPKDGREGYQISMKALDVEQKSTRDWADWISLSDFADGKLDGHVSRGLETLTKDDSIGPVVTGVTGPGPGPKPGGKKSNMGWKITAYAATAVTIGLGVSGYVFRDKAKSLESKCHPAAMGSLSDPGTYTNQDIANGEPSANECAKGPGHSTKAWVTGLSAAAIGTFALLAYYQGFVAKKESPTQTGSRVRKKKNFAVTPVVTPDGAGATVRIDW